MFTVQQVLPGLEAIGYNIWFEELLDEPVKNRLNCGYDERWFWRENQAEPILRAGPMEGDQMTRGKLLKELAEGTGLEPASPCGRRFSRPLHYQLCDPSALRLTNYTAEN